MRSTLLSTLFLLFHRALTTPSADNTEAQQNAVDFQALLGGVPANALHSALHTFQPKRFQHGAFVEDTAAASAVWQDNPALATTMVMVAKRQARGPAAPAGPPNSTSTPPPVTVTSTITTPGTTSIAVITSTFKPTPPISPTPLPAPTKSSSSIPTQPAPIVSTPSTVTEITQTTAGPTAVLTTFSSAPTTTPTTPSSSVFLTFDTPSAPLSSFVMETTMLGNGQLSTLTAVTVVDETGKTETQPSSTVAATGSLQSPNAAANLRPGWGLVGAGAVAVLLRAF